MDKAVKKIDGIGAYFAERPLITVLGLKYLHLRMQDGTDLYVTEHGLPFTKCLMPRTIGPTRLGARPVPCNCPAPARSIA